MTVRHVAAQVLAVVLLLVPGQASAVDLGQWVRGLKVSLFVTERAEYETNVFQVTSDTQDDIILRTVPGFLVTLERGPVTLGAGYRAEILKFTSLEEQDNTHHIGSVQFGLNFRPVTFGMRQDFRLTSDPPNTEITGRIDSTTVVIAPEVEYRLTQRFSVGANYSFTHVQFETRAEELNRDEHLYGGSIFWKFLPKADIRLGYQYGYKEFDNIIGERDRDHQRHMFLIGLRGDLTPKLSSTFRVGYELRNQEDGRLQDDRLLTLGGDWTYRPTERTRINLATSKGFEESTFGQLGETVVYETTSGTLSLEQQFGTKVRANARITGVLNEYPRKEFTVREEGIRPLKFREDTLFGWGGGIDYDIQKWLSVGAEYSHTRRDSTFDEFDYKNDKFIAKLTLQF